MTVKFQKFIDREPLIVSFETSPNAGPDIAQLRQVVVQWFACRDENPVCTNRCLMKYLDVGVAKEGYRIAVEQACKQCLDLFLRYLSEQFPSFVTARVGRREGANVGPIPASGRRFLRIARREVTAESGQVSIVQEFWISEFPISVGEYERFSESTGYLTSAELEKPRVSRVRTVNLDNSSERTQRTRAPQTYKRNGALFGMALGNHGTFEARHLSYNDALAYCGWRAARLPTDIELLAAMTIDDDIRQIPNGSSPSSEMPTELIKVQGRTITATCDGGNVLVRWGPWITKRPGWDEKGKNCEWCGVNVPAGQFYIVTDQI